MPAIIPRREGLLGRVSEWDPLETMRELMRFDPFSRMGALPVTREGGFVPTFEVKETKDAYVFKADVPGLKEENIDISLTGNRLTISGERTEDKREEGERYYAYERAYGTFNRSFTLPEGVDADHVHAEMKDGVLHVVLPKRPEVQPKKIALKGKEKTAKA